MNAKFSSVIHSLGAPPIGLSFDIPRVWASCEMKMYLAKSSGMFCSSEEMILRIEP
jgi:hypothetical protein